MCFLVLGTLLLFTNTSVHPYETYDARYETYNPPPQSQWLAAAFEVGKEEISAKESDPYDPRHDRLYRAYLLATILGVVGGILGVVLIFWQVKLLKRSVDASSEQSKAMERHLKEAARSATAMETIAKTIDIGNRAVMRAYLTVTIGDAVFQERRVPGQPDKKFVARPNLVNTGNSAARRVRMRKTAAVIPNPVPNDFAFPLPPENNEGDATVGAHLSYIMASAVGDFVPIADVADIKQGIGRCLCTWGVVTYEDIFGEEHTTKFAQNLYWNSDNTVYGIYVPGQNDAD